MIRYPVKINLRLNKEMVDDLKDAAEEERRSTSLLIRLILQDWLVERIKKDL